MNSNNQTQGIVTANAHPWCAHPAKKIWKSCHGVHLSRNSSSSSSSSENVSPTNARTSLLRHQPPTTQLMPRPTDLSYYNWETQTSTSTSTPNFQVSFCSLVTFILSSTYSICPSFWILLFSLRPSLTSRSYNKRGGDSIRDGNRSEQNKPLCCGAGRRCSIEE